MTLTKVFVLGGGWSRERDISLRSSRSVFEALIRRGVSAQFHDIQSASDLDRLRFSEDTIVLPILHGKGGEDGFIQLYFQARGIAFLGSKASSSAIAFHKGQSRELLSAAGLKIAKGSCLSSIRDLENKIQEDRTYVLKPCDEGSSIDVYFCTGVSEVFEQASELFSRYNEMILEEALIGREMTVGILGDRALPVLEIIPSKGFYDFSTKYTPGNCTYQVPAEISETLAREIRSQAVAAHQCLGLRDLSRVDMILTSEGAHILEVNTMPGFTETSLLPKAALAQGISFDDLCLLLVEQVKTRTLKEEPHDKISTS